MNTLKIPLFVALDVDSDTQALRIAHATTPFVGGFKVGPRLCLRYGAALIGQLAQLGLVFVDNKYFDIPNTMEAAVRASFEAGASFVTIHAQSGPSALRRLAEVERELNQQRPFCLLSVTVLTSFDQQSLPPNSCQQPIADQVKSLSQLSIDSGLSGLVCAGSEVQSLRQAYSEAFLLVPGIRLPHQRSGDQKRVMGPREAIKAGASALVVGRPICDSADPAEAAREFFDLLSP